MATIDDRRAGPAGSELSEFVATAPEAILVLDEDGAIVRVNRIAEKLFGIPEQKALGRPVGELIALRDAAPEAAPLTPSRLAAAEDTVALCSDGPPVPIAVSLSHQAPATTYAFLHDLRGVRRLEDELQRRDAELSSARLVAGLGSWEIDYAGSSVRWSERMSELLGFSADTPSMTLESLLARVHPADLAEVREAIDRARATGHYPTMEARWETRDGAFRTFVAHGKLTHAPGHADARLVGVAWDVTDIRLAEEELHAFYELADALAEWEAKEGTALSLLERTAAALGYEVGALWLGDERQGAARCIALWAREGERHDVVAGGGSEAIDRDDVLVDRVWSTGSPILLDDVSGDPQLARLLGRAGTSLRSVLAFPLKVDGHMNGCVELYGSEAIQTSKHLSRTLSALGHQLGSFLARHGGTLDEPPITRREREVLQLAARGLTGAGIAAELAVSLSTVKTHFEKIYVKLGVSDRPAAVAEGFRRGLID